MSCAELLTTVLAEELPHPQTEARRRTQERQTAMSLFDIFSFPFYGLVDIYRITQASKNVKQSIHQMIIKYPIAQIILSQEVML